MRRRLSAIGILLLVMAVVLAGLTACTRSANVRETATTEPSTTEEVEGPPAGEGATPAPGETVVSAVTPAPGGSTSSTQAPSSAQPTAEPPTPVEATAGTEATAASETAETPVPATPQAAEGDVNIVEHTVVRDESLDSIAARYGTTVKAIQDANDMGNSTDIQTGQKLKVPSSSTSMPASTTSDCRYQHTVKKGEWVYMIARRYGVSPDSIIRVNGLRNPSVIHAGLVLCIP
jgi:LysM repeat protein